MTSSTSCQRFELFSSGLNRRKFRAVQIELHHIAKELAHDARASAVTAPGLRHFHGIVAEVGQAEVSAAAGRRWHAGWRSCAARPSAADLGQFGLAAGR